MTTVTSKLSGRTYQVTSQLYGTSSTVYYLWYGGIGVASTSTRGSNLESAITTADEYCDRLGIMASETGLENN